MTATPTTNTYGGYGGQDILTVSNTKCDHSPDHHHQGGPDDRRDPQRRLQQLPRRNRHDDVWHGERERHLTSTYVLNSGHSIPAGSPSGSFAAQYGGTGSARVQTGDTWTVVSTSNGVTSTLSGHF